MKTMEALNLSAIEAEHALVVSDEINRMISLRFDPITAINLLTAKIKRLDTSMVDYSGPQTNTNTVSYANGSNNSTTSMLHVISRASPLTTIEKKGILDDSSRKRIAGDTLLEGGEEETKRRKINAISAPISINSKRVREEEDVDMVAKMEESSSSNKKIKKTESGN
jgi:hypothetical protein